MTATFCRAPLNYVPAAGAGGFGRDVEIRDGRTAELPGWDACGFELVDHASAVVDWHDEDALQNVHHPEVEALAKQMTGADVALVSGHIHRSPEDAKRHSDMSPITFVHSDFAATHQEIIRNSYRSEPGERPGSDAALARNGVTADDVAGARRLVILQFWRNLGPAKMDFPIAFCDARSVELDHGRAFHVTNYGGSGFDFDALAVVAPEGSAHQWYAFPELRPDEAIAFRTYDTALVEAGEVFFTPHSAFRDPDVPVGKPSRSSIELRATCLFR